MTSIELIDTVPVLSVSDVTASLTFYRERLGFATEFDMSGTYPYAGVRRGPLTLHLDGGSHEFAARTTHCRFHIRGVDAQGVVKADERLTRHPTAFGSSACSTRMGTASRSQSRL
jgi:catechol 2,3-dioxygenase-like lactoylglutathione lyase family enzyme